MKKIFLLLPPLLFSLAATSQTKPAKTKAPTQKHMKDMQKQAQEMMDEMMKEMDPEDKKMMDSMGIKMPDMKKLGKMPANISDAQLSKAMEDDSRIVPGKDAARIAAIPAGLTVAKLPVYLSSLHQKTASTLDANRTKIASDLFLQLKSMAGSPAKAGSMALAFWLSGQPDIATYLLGRVCNEDPSNTDNLSNYTSMLVMQGGQHLAIPLLDLLNAKFPRNNTILNNLGQAWFGLGDMTKAGKYLDSAIAIYPYHPQANLTKASIEESKGNKTKAIECLKKSIRHAYTKDKEDKLSRLGYKITRKDIRIQLPSDPDPLGLESTRRPDYPTTISQATALAPLWKQFNQDCEIRMGKLQKEVAEQSKRYVKSAAALASKTMAAIQNGHVPSLNLETMYARKAGFVLKEREEYFGRKFKKMTELYMQLQTDLTEIRASHKIPAPEAHCTVHRDAANKLLKALNERKKWYDDEALKIFRQYCNEMAYWGQYTSADKAAAAVVKMDFQKLWLEKNRELQPEEMNNYIGLYADCVEKEDAKPGKLAEFDDIACKYKSTINFGIIVQENNCSHTTTTYNFGNVKITERELGVKYIGGTVKLSPKLSKGVSYGPLTIEAFIGADININLDENHQVKDWDGTVSTGVEAGVGISKGPLDAGASVSGAVEVEIGSKGIGDINMVTTAEAGAGALGQKISVGVEDRVSLVSGHGSVTGTGMLSGVTMSKW